MLQDLVHFISGGHEEVATALLVLIASTFFAMSLWVKTLPKARENRLEREKVEIDKDALLTKTLQDLLTKAQQDTKRISTLEEKIKSSQEAYEAKVKSLETKITSLTSEIDTLKSSRSLLKTSVQNVLLQLKGETYDVPTDTKDLAEDLVSLIPQLKSGNGEE